MNEEFVAVTFQGPETDFTTTLGRFRRGREMRVAEPDAQWLLSLCDRFEHGQDIIDSNGAPLRPFQPMNISMLNVKAGRIGEIVAFAREYGFGDMITAILFACLPAKIQSPDSNVIFYVPGPYVKFFETFDIVDEVRALQPDYETIAGFDSYIDLTRVPQFHSVDSRNVSRPEIFGSIVEGSNYEYEAYKPPEEYLVKARKHIEELNTEGRKVIGMSFTSTSMVRTYPASQIRKIIEYFAKEFFIVLLGTDNHRWGMKQWNGDNLLSMIDDTPDILDLAAYCALCDYAISNDQGIMHLFAAEKIRTLALFGNIDPLSRIKFYPTVTALYPKDELACIPCGDKFNPCPRTDEKYGGACLWLLTHDRVIKAFETAILGKTVKDDELFRKILRINETLGERGEDKRYPYFPSKTPFEEKPRYKVVIVVPHIFLGGGETQLNYLLDAIRNTEFAIEMIVMGNIDEVLFPVISKKIKTHVMSEGQNRIKALREKIVETDPDVILYHGTDYLSVALEGVKKKPVVIQILHTGVGMWTEGVLRTGTKINDAAIAVADWIRRKFKREYPDLNIYTVNNGVPDINRVYNSSARETFGLNDEDFVIGCMSRFSGEKCISLLIEAIQFLPSNAKLLLAGWGKIEDDLKTIAERVADGRVIFAGAVMDRERFFDAVDCCALTSMGEGNSMFLLEAAMEKKPILTTKVGAAPDLFVEAESALFIDRDVKSISEAILLLMHNEELRRNIGLNAYDVVSRNSTDITMAQGYRDVILHEIHRRIYPLQILAFRSGGHGDMLMTIPAMKRLRKMFPYAIITYVASEQYLSTIRGIGCIDNFLALSRGMTYKDLARRFDLAFHFQHYEVWDTQQHIIDFYLDLVGAEGRVDRSLEINLDGVKNPISFRPYVCIHTSSNFDCKNWGTPEQWEVIVEYLKKKYQVIHIGTDNEPDLGAFVVYNKGYNTKTTAKILEEAIFFVGIDSYPVHASRAVKTPSVIVYGGASHPDFCGYVENENVVSTCPCRCDLTKVGGANCTKQLICLTTITTENVLDAIKKLEENINEVK